MFESVCVHNGQIQTLKRVIANGHPILYLPVHHSVYDAFLISYVLINNGLTPPVFFAPGYLKRSIFFRYSVIVCSKIY